MISETKFKEIFGSGQRMSESYLKSAEGLKRRAEVWKLLKTVEGVNSYRKLCEAITTSDFSYLLTSDMNARLLDAHARYPVSYQNWTKTIRVNDFKSNPLPALERPTRLLKAIGQTDGLPRTGVSELNYTIQIGTLEDSIELTRQTIINDALGAFNSIPTGFAEEAAMTAEQLATTMVADLNGPHATLFDNSTKKNLITDQLSLAGVENAWNTMTAQKDSQGLPIYVRPKGILVPPQLEMKAKEIVSALSVDRYDMGSPEVGYRTSGNNPLAGLEISVDPWITAISTSNSYAAKQWYLYADPNVGRPAVAFALLNSAPTPQLFRKIPSAENISGGGQDPFSYDYNSIDYKVRWDIGASQIDFRYMVASKPTS